MFDQVLLRIGINSSAVSAGLGRVTGLVKGWTTSIAHHLAGALGGIFAFAAIERGFERIKERILAIKRVSDDLGVNTNFAQGLMFQSEKAGLGMEEFEKPLLRFSALLGQAKEGSVEARKKLIDWGLATKDTNFKAFNLQDGLVALSKSFDGLNDVEKRNAMLSELTGKGYQNIIPIMEKGAAGIERMSSNNPLTKITPETIKEANGLYEVIKKISEVVWASGSNAVMGLFGKISGGQINREREEFEKMRDTLTKTDEIKQDSVKLTEEENAFQREKNELIERELELRGKIDDRGKLSVEALAAQGRRLSGTSKVPRGLSAVRVITPAMRQAMDIASLEDREAVAFAMGDISGATSARSEADKARRGLGVGFRLEDRRPIEGLQNTLDDLHKVMTTKGIAISAIRTQ